MELQARGRKLIKFSGIVLILAGLIALFVGMYFLVSALTIQDESDTAELMRMQNNFTKAGTYVTLAGIYACVAGLYGVINFENADAFEKCRNFAFGMLGICVIDCVLLAVYASRITWMNVLVLVIPAAASIVYLAGSLINLREYRNAIREKEQNHG